MSNILPPKKKLAREEKATTTSHRNSKPRNQKNFKQFFKMNILTQHVHIVRHPFHIRSCYATPIYVREGLLTQIKTTSVHKGMTSQLRDC